MKCKKIIFIFVSCFFIFFNNLSNILQDLRIFKYNKKYFNFSKKINKDVGILVVAFNRPAYFKEVLESLERNPESEYLPFFFVLDGGPKALQNEHISMIKKSKIKNKYIIKRKLNFGCEKNIIDARRFMFDWCNFDKVFVFEDDLVIAPNYIELILNLNDWAKKNYNNIGFVKGWHPCFSDRLEKSKKLNFIISDFSHLWGYCMNKKVWDNIKSLIYEYEENFYKNLPCRAVLDSDILTWIKSKGNSLSIKHKKRLINNFDFLTHFINKNKSTGQDAITHFALFKNDYLPISTVVNRSYYIGKIGLHSTLEFYNRENFGNMKLDVFDEDKNIKEFKLAS